MDGLELEQLVARLEKALLPSGFSTTLRDKRFNDAGVQIAEFDIVVTGCVGSSTLTCLIECRDRPSDGSAPAAWIEQLVGRRERFGFDKVLAVSTTGFSPAAVEYASKSRIDLRSVTSLSHADIADWIEPDHFIVIHRKPSLAEVKLLIADSESPERIAAFNHVLSKNGADAPFLRAKSGEYGSPSAAFTAVVERLGLWPDEPVHGWSQKVSITTNYDEDDRYAVATEHGEVEVVQIIFTGLLATELEAIPFEGSLSIGMHRMGRGSRRPPALACLSPKDISHSHSTNWQPMGKRAFLFERIAGKVHSGLTSR